MAPRTRIPGNRTKSAAQLLGRGGQRRCQRSAWQGLMPWRGAFACRRRAEKARDLCRATRLERPRGISPADVATILPAHDAIDRDVVQTATEELDLAQQILNQVGKQAPKIVTLAANRCGASGIERCGRWRHGQRQHRLQTRFQRGSHIAADRVERGDSRRSPGRCCESWSRNIFAVDHSVPASCSCNGPDAWLRHACRHTPGDPISDTAGIEFGAPPAETDARPRLMGISLSDPASTRVDEPGFHVEPRGGGPTA